MNTDLPQKALDLWRQGLSPAQIADMLNAEGHRTVTGSEFQATTVWRMIDRLRRGNERMAGDEDARDRAGGGGGQGSAAGSDGP